MCMIMVMMLVMLKVIVTVMMVPVATKAFATAITVELYPYSAH